MNNFYKTPVFLLFTIYFIFGLLYEAYLWTLPSHTTLWNFAINFVNANVFFAGGVYGIYHAFKSGITSTIGRAIFILGLGLCSWAAGLYIWFWHNMILKIEVPFPSIIDFFFIVFFILLAAGIIILIKLFSPSLRPRVVFDSVLISVISAIAVIYLLSPDASASLPPLVRIINVAYPLGNAIVVSLILIIIRVGGGSIRNSFPLFVTGLVFHSFASFMFGIGIKNGTYWNGDFADGGLLFASYFLSIGLAKIIYSYNTKSSSMVT